MNPDTNAMTIREYSRMTPGLLGRSSYSSLCELIGVPKIQNGYGALHVVDADGQRQTLLTEDPTYIDSVASAADIFQSGDIHPGKFRYIVQGWPDEWRAQNGGTGR